MSVEDSDAMSTLPPGSDRGTHSAASPSLADRLRDVDEQNALVVRRRAADRIEELEAELVEQRSFLLSEVHRAEDERDSERHRAVVAETKLMRRIFR